MVFFAVSCLCLSILCNSSPTLPVTTAPLHALLRSTFIAIFNQNAIEYIAAVGGVRRLLSPPSSVQVVWRSISQPVSVQYPVPTGADYPKFWKAVFIVQASPGSVRARLSMLSILVISSLVQIDIFGFLSNVRCSHASLNDWDSFWGMCR